MKALSGIVSLLKTFLRKTLPGASLLLMVVSPATLSDQSASDARVSRAREHVAAELGSCFGRPVFIRIIKEELLLELWCQDKQGTWDILRRYPIAAMSGDLGPKTAEGDLQAPEGFYEVRPGGMNPRSSFHLSFNIGYPNAYDQKLGRTGSFIMIHGGEASIGCFAMTDPVIEEIYTMVHEAHAAGQTCVPVQIYPFRMTKERMEEEKESPHYAFWRNLLLPGWQDTELHRRPYTPSEEAR